ncbi:hypothetical protein E4A48_01365 [Xanthomonas cerealis pv. cerealis]|uniref:Helicase n=2 Tax=Xanthomonas translucens group TaxID=3390202 RepID=A0A514E917_9XANT|nr:hypothetical protein E4A48_01365 [Xanthomonas translucens pv. cerealis]
MSVEPNYFLPASRATLSSFLDAHQVPDSPLGMAALLVAITGAAPSTPPSKLTRMIDEACRLFGKDPESGRLYLLRLASEVPRSIDEWERQLSLQGIALADENTADGFCAMSPDAFPVDQFQAACRTTLGPHTVRFYGEGALVEQEDSEEDDIDDGETGKRISAYVERTTDYTVDQVRAIRSLIANADEHIDLDAYAGTGKTHIVSELLAHDARHFTFVTPSAAQAQALRSRLGAGKLRVLTMIRFANLVAARAFEQRALSTDFKPVWQKSTASLADIASVIGVQRIGGYSPTAVLRIAFEGISRWCRSSSIDLQPDHFNRVVMGAMIDSTAYIAAAEHVWRSMFSAEIQKQIKMIINVDHIGKWLAQHRVKLPTHWGTIVVDEGHDMSAAWKSLLSDYAGGVISLGDPNQRLIGTAPRFLQGKSLEMTQSVRQGQAVDSLVNGAMRLDSTGIYSSLFAGTADHATVTSTYGAWRDVPQVGTRIFGSPFTLLEEALRLIDAGARVGIHNFSVELIQREVGLIEDAFRAYDHGVSGDYRWRDFHKECSRLGKPQITRLFERGFGSTQFKELVGKLSPFDSARTKLALVEHVKNSEHPIVSMARCCFESIYTPQRAHNPVRAVYTALTRGSQQLWVPPDALDALRVSNEHFHEQRQQRKAKRVVRPDLRYQKPIQR